MRELIIQDLMNLKKKDGFNINSGRWCNFWVANPYVAKFIYFADKSFIKEVSPDASDVKHLSELDFNNLTDDNLLAAYRTILIRSHMQM